MPLCVANELFHRETQRRLREPRGKSPESNLSAAFLGREELILINPVVVSKLQVRHALDE